MSPEDTFLTPAFFADPYPVYERMREQGPLYLSERMSGRWLVTTYAACEPGLRDNRWSKRMVDSLISNRPAEAQQELQPLVSSLSRQMLFADPPEHTRLRALVSKAFTPRTVEKLRPHVEQIASRLLDDVLAKGEMDLIHDFAFPLPATVICEMLGIPPERRDEFRHWSDDAALWLGNVTGDPDVDRRVMGSVHEANDYFASFAEELRKHPKDDVLSAMVLAEEGGQHLTTDELTANAMLLLAAGHETTTNLIGNSVLALLRHPDQFELLRREPERIAGAVEELVRYDSPVQLVARLTPIEMEVAERTFPPGTLVGFLIGSANRDPEAFPEPDRLDVTRENPKHLSFAHGIHYCLGAALARAEGEIALRLILERLPGLRLASDDGRFHPNVTIRGVESLSLTWETPALSFRT